MVDKKLWIFWSWLWRATVFILLALYVSFIMNMILFQLTFDLHINIPFVKWIPYLIGGLGIFIAIVVAFYLVRSQDMLCFKIMSKYPVVIFRMMIVLFLTSMLIVTLNYLFWHLGWDEQALDYLYWRISQPHSELNQIIGVINLIFAIFNAFALVGLFMFNKSARYCYVVTLGLYLLTGYVDYPYINSGFENVVLYVAYMLIGSTIALSFVNPFKNYFLQEKVKNA